MSAGTEGRVTEFCFGDRVVLVPKAFPDLTRPANLESIARANRLHVVWVHDPPGLFAERWTEERLHLEYASNEGLRQHYRGILAVQERIAPQVVFIMGDGGYWHPELLQSLKRRSTVAFWTGDDPEGSDITSRPFVRHYDFAFCGGIYFSKGVTIAEKFREWGAPRSKFIPLGACADKYVLQNGRSDDDFFSRQRDIDLIYIGAAYRGKLWRVLTLKRHFKDRLLLGGRRWDGRGLGWKGAAVRLFQWLGGLGEIHEVPDADLLALYQRAKVGFNCHLSFGPSNLRTYELPLNGALQVCDCEDGLSQLYDLRREVVSYASMTDAIRRIEYYLAHEQERIEVAKAGYARALRDYRMESSFGRVFAALDQIASSSRKAAGPP